MVQETNKNDNITATRVFFSVRNVSQHHKKVSKVGVTHPGTEFFLGRLTNMVMKISVSIQNQYFYLWKTYELLCTIDLISMFCTHGRTWHLTRMGPGSPLLGWLWLVWTKLTLPSNHISKIRLTSKEGIKLIAYIFWKKCSLFISVTVNCGVQVDFLFW